MNYKIDYYIIYICLIFSLGMTTYSGCQQEPKFPPGSQVYIDSMVDVGNVVEFNPRTQMLILMWDKNKNRYIKIVEKDDVCYYE